MDPETAKQITSKPPRRAFASITSELGDYQGDIAFMRFSESAKYRAKNDGMTCILIVIETASRYAYAVPMQNKEAHTVVKTFSAIYMQVRNQWRYINRLTTDDGHEFNNREWDALMRDCLIKQYVKEPGDRFSLGIIDRFTRTFKTMIEDLQIREQSLNWTSYIPQVLAQYNARFNSNIGASPILVRESVQMQDAANAHDESRGVAGVRLFERFKVGSYVRIRLRPSEQPRESSSLAHPSDRISKGIERWSFKVYQIQKIDGFSFELVDSTGNKLKRDYRAHELLLVPSGSRDAPDVFASVASQARKARRAKHEDL